MAEETKEFKITLSELAAQMLHETIAEQCPEVDQTKVALRVWVMGGGCSGLQYGMAIDDNPPEEIDTVVEDQGVKIVVDGLSAKYVSGSVIEWEEDILGGGFKIANPNATKSCGCSQSFSTSDDAAGLTITGQCSSCPSGGN